MKLVINKCYGGFGLSNKAESAYLKKQGKEAFFYNQVEFAHQNGKNIYERIDDGSGSSFSHTLILDLGETFSGELPADAYWSYYDLERDDPDLISVVEELGEEEASGDCSKLQVVEIPDGIEYEIDDYDGLESIHESHRSW